ncbi:MAG: SEC-C metal-binding domain-containing protein [Victivallaceae bacterium]|nr:SEC-C metal-binding domain-containing protein [Victivallaceae bacterium]
MPYAPFHARFPDIAEKETRSLIIHGDPELPDDRYILVELYCDEKNCDCRRVFFDVLSENTKKSLAVITYGWEKRQYYIDWMGDSNPDVIDSLVGVGLNLSSFQSNLAQALLKKIDFILKNDTSYVERLKRHYKIFRKEIDKQNKIAPFVSQPKIGRNDPCPCGSGKKYKKCCLN